MSEFDAIEGVDGWRRKLEALLREAEQAARDEERRFEIAARLREFVRNSGPQVPDIARLDDIASATVRALMNQTIDARLAELADRSVELARLAKAIDAVAVDAAAAGDQVDQHAEQWEGDHEDQPERLAPPTEVVAVEDVTDDLEQRDEPRDPQEEPEHRPKQAEQWIVVCQHGSPSDR